MLWPLRLLPVSRTVPEGWPTASAVELGVAGVQWSITSLAQVCSLGMLLRVSSVARLRVLLTQHRVLLRRQLLAPLRVRLREGIASSSGGRFVSSSSTHAANGVRDGQGSSGESERSGGGEVRSNLSDSLQSARRRQGDPSSESGQNGDGGKRARWMESECDNESSGVSSTCLPVAAQRRFIQRRLADWRRLALCARCVDCRWVDCDSLATTGAVVECAAAAARSCCDCSALGPRSAAAVAEDAGAAREKAPAGEAEQQQDNTNTRDGTRRAARAGRWRPGFC